MDAAGVAVGGAARICRRKRQPDADEDESGGREWALPARSAVEAGDADDDDDVDVDVDDAVDAAGAAALRRRRWKRATLPSPVRPFPAAWQDRKRRLRLQSRVFQTRPA